MGSSTSVLGANAQCYLRQKLKSDAFCSVKFAAAAVQSTTAILVWRNLYSRNLYSPKQSFGGGAKTSGEAARKSLSNYNGDGNENVTKQQVLISKTMPCTCVLHFGTFLCRSLQNNNVK